MNNFERLSITYYYFNYINNDNEARQMIECNIKS